MNLDEPPNPVLYVFCHIELLTFFDILKPEKVRTVSNLRQLLHEEMLTIGFFLSESGKLVFEVRKFFEKVGNSFSGNIFYKNVCLEESCQVNCRLFHFVDCCVEGILSPFPKF